MSFLPDKEYQRRKTTNYIVVHCSATKPSQDVGVEQIRKWHIEERKWNDVGYHFVIKRDGNWQIGRPVWAIGSHVEGRNWESIGICLVGGVDEEGQPASNFTAPQLDALARLVLSLKRDSYRKAQVVGHHDIQVVTHKVCPSFDAKSWWAPFETQVQEEITRGQCLG